MFRRFNDCVIPKSSMGVDLWHHLYSQNPAMIRYFHMHGTMDGWGQSQERLVESDVTKVVTAFRGWPEEKSDSRVSDLVHDFADADELEGLFFERGSTPPQKRYLKLLASTGGVVIDGGELCFPGTTDGLKAFWERESAEWPSRQEHQKRLIDERARRTKPRRHLAEGTLDVLGPMLVERDGFCWIPIGESANGERFLLKLDVATGSEQVFFYDRTGDRLLVPMAGDDAFDVLDKLERGAFNEMLWEEPVDGPHGASAMRAD